MHATAVKRSFFITLGFFTFKYSNENVFACNDVPSLL